MSSGSSFSARLVEVRANPWVVGLASLAPLATFASLVVASHHDPASFLFIPYTALAGAALGYTAWRDRWRALRSKVRVKADGEGVKIGKRHIDRASLQTGLVMPGHPPSVRLIGTSSAILEVDSVDEGRDLLRALGLDSSQSVAEFSGLSRVFASTGYLLTAIFGGVLYAALHDLAHTKAIALAGSLALLVVGAVVFWKSKLRVGADGISLRWLGRERFVGYDTIDTVTTFERGFGRSRVRGVKLLLRTREEVSIPLGASGLGREDPSILFEERVNEAMEAHRHRSGARADADLLRRGARSASDWVTALRSLGAGANADLRTAPVPRERLLRIVEDPSASATSRAAAAVAIGASLDSDARARLQAAAASTAGAKLRIAIDAAAAEATEADLEAALEAVESESATAKA